MQLPLITNKPAPEGRYPINLYITTETERSAPALLKVPGLVHRVTPMDLEPIRGMIVMGDYLYVVVHDSVYKISSAWSATKCTGTLPATTGTPWMIQNGSQLLIVDNMAGKILEDDTIAAVDLPGTPRCITLQDTYGIMTGIDTNGREQFWYSSAGDLSAWDVLDVGDRYANDITHCVISESRKVHFIGSETCEMFYNTGDVDTLFQRIEGSTKQIGILAPHSLSYCDQALYFLDSNKRIVMHHGAGVQVKSTPELERLVAGYAAPEDAVAHTIYWQGHAWYVISFAEATWIYDTSTDSWFQWSSGLEGGRARINAYAYFNGYHVVGDYSNGKLYTLDADTYTEDGGTIKWQRTVPPIIAEGRKVFHHALELDMKKGVGLITGHGIDSEEGPKIWLDWSDNDGRTWSNEHWASIGKIGEYSIRVRWNRLGASRNRMYRVTGTEPVITEIYGAFLSATVGAN